MPVDTLTPDATAATLSTPPPDGGVNPYTETDFAVMGGDPDEIVVAAEGATGLIASGYGLDGALLFRNLLANSGPFLTSEDLHLATIPTGGVAAVWLGQTHGSAEYNPGPDQTSVIGADGSFVAAQPIDTPLARDSTTAVFSTPAGYHVEWLQTADQYHPQSVGYQTVVMAEDFLANGQPAGVATVLPFWQAYANVALNGQDLLIQDNQAQWGVDAAVTVPGEPGHAMTEAAAAALSGGVSAAVAWADSGTDYVSIYDSATNSFGARIGLDWGGASDLHLVALPDGGFVVSWQNGGADKGEVFDAAGNGGGIIPLAGDVAGIDSQGDLYTVGLNGGQYAVQTYAINGSGGGGSGSGSSVSTSDPNYTAPAGVTTITLTGSHQTIHANDGGDTIFSNDTGNALYGGTGNDTFHMGRGGDWATGGGGGDTYDFAAIPWAAGGITDFGAGDTLDLGGLLTTTQDIPAGGFSDGYLQLTDDGAGDTDVWARYATSGANSNWWLVTVLDGITTASLDAHHTVVTLSPNAHDVTTSAADYVAPSYVSQINLTGSQQHVDATATNGVFIASNDSGNVLIGGAGNDTFFLGRGGDWVAGGAGADTFAYLGTPWAGGGITDFNAGEGDKIDVSRLLAASGYTGTDPFADGYLQLTSDSSGNAQLWSDVHQAGNDGWWLVATLDGVSTSSLHYSGGLIT